MPDLNAGDVAAELRRRLPNLGQKKLHKLLYYCQGHHLAAFDTAMFRDTISCYDMGPVVGTLWRAEKDNGPVTSGTVLDEAALNTVGYVVSRYGGLSGMDLERLTHSETPWIEANRIREENGERRSTISVESMADYFRHEPTDGPEDEVVLDEGELRAWLDEAVANPDPQPDSLDELQRRLTTGA